MLKVSPIGEWLRQVCQRDGLSLRDAAGKTGLSHTTIEGIMTKGVSPSSDTIKKLAHAFSSGDGHEAIALEDKLLVLAGYKTSRPDGEEMSQELGRLLDLVSGFDEAKLKLVSDFANFLKEKV